MRALSSGWQAIARHADGRGGRRAGAVWIRRDGGSTARHQLTWLRPSVDAAGRARTRDPRSKNALSRYFALGYKVVGCSAINAHQALQPRCDCGRHRTPFEIRCLHRNPDTPQSSPLVVIERVVRAPRQRSCSACSSRARWGQRRSSSSEVSGSSCGRRHSRRRSRERRRS